jgi:hypothetical protein
MHSKDIPRLKGPLHALLWEQWRMTRPVLLLPVVGVLIAAIAWYALANDFRERALFPFFIYSAAFTALMLLLCVPDGKMNLRLDDAGRYQRLSVPFWQVATITLLLRGMIAFTCAFILSACVVAVFLYPAIPDKVEHLYILLRQPLERAIAFTCAFLMLHGLVKSVSYWGELLAAVLLVVACVALCFLAAPFTEFVASLPLVVLTTSLAISIAGMYLQDVLSRRRPATQLLSHLRDAKSFKRTVDIPRFSSTAQAQRWLERRRFGWMLLFAPVAALVLIIAMDIASEFKVSRDEPWLMISLGATSFLPFVSCMALLINVADYRLFHATAGKYLFVRPLTPSMYASARMLNSARMLALAFLGQCIAISLALAAIAFLRQDYSFLNYETLTRHFLMLIESDAGEFIAVGIVVLLMPISFNRWTAIGFVVLSLLGMFLVPPIVTLAAGLLMLVLAAGVAHRAGLWNSSSLLALLILSVPVSRAMLYYDLVPKELIAMLFVSRAGCIALPFGFHFSRSSTWFPLQQQRVSR